MIYWATEPQTIEPIQAFTSVSGQGFFQGPGAASKFTSSFFSSGSTSVNRFGTTIAYSSTGKGEEPGATEGYYGVGSSTSYVVTSPAGTIPIQTTTTGSASRSFSATTTQTANSTKWTTSTHLVDSTYTKTLFVNTLETVTRTTTTQGATSATIVELTNTGSRYPYVNDDYIFEAFTINGQNPQRANVLCIYQNASDGDKKTEYTTATRTTISPSIFTSATLFQTAESLGGITQGETFYTRKDTTTVDFNQQPGFTRQIVRTPYGVAGDKQTVANGMFYEPMFGQYEVDAYSVHRGVVSAFPQSYTVESGKTLSISHLSATLFVSTTTSSESFSELIQANESSTNVGNDANIIGGNFYNGESVEYTIGSGVYRVINSIGTATQTVDENIIVSASGPVEIPTSRFETIRAGKTFTANESIISDFVTSSFRNSIELPP